MFKLKILKSEPDDRHQELFVARYECLLKWSLKLSNHDWEQAEDLVHDAFIQFTFTRPDLEKIQNIDGYLYGMLRHLRLSQVRRAARHPVRPLSVIEYETAEASLRSNTEIQNSLQVRDELQKICLYACQRKQTSKIGSVLILRFFHGYYPGEIVRITQSTPAGVRKLLQLARAEAKSCLNEIEPIQTMNGISVANQRGFSKSETTDPLSLLRTMIFNSRQGSCFSTKQLRTYYQEASTSVTGVETIGLSALAHIVSCPNCLEKVNKILSLTSLSDRYPPEMLGPEPGIQQDDKFTSRSLNASIKRCLARSKRKATEVYEHQLRELCISVNGHILVTQKISSTRSEYVLSINVGEEIGFAEVLSGDGVRLLMLNTEPPPNGETEQSSAVALSDQRRIALSLSYASPWPSLSVTYHDPTFQEKVKPNQASTTNFPASLPHPLINDGWRDGVRSFGGWKWLLQPGAIAFALTILCVTTLLVYQWRFAVGIVSAAELLHRSSVIEAKEISDPSTALHRVINLEVRNPANHQLFSRRRVEVWQSSAKETKVRRLYDENGSLLSAQFWQKNEAPQLYSKTSTAASTEQTALLSEQNIWQAELNADDFVRLTGNPEKSQVEERPDSYTINYHADEKSSDSVLLAATLKLSRREMRPIEQTLLIRRGDNQREIKFVAVKYELQPLRSISPAVFQIDPELAPNEAHVVMPKESSPRELQKDNGDLTAASKDAEISASPEFEVEVLRLLHEAGADLGEQISVTRTTGGKLRLDALVETEGRKGEILRALQTVIHHPALIVNLKTVEESLKASGNKSPSAPTTVRDVEVNASRMPADPELRRYFSARFTDETQVNNEINRFAGAMINHSRQALLHASALKKLSERFSPHDVAAIDLNARAKLKTLATQHTLAYRREIYSLRSALQSVFQIADTSGKIDEALLKENPAQAVEQLLKISYSLDTAVRSSFTISENKETTAAVKSAEFSHSLQRAELLIGTIQKGYQ